MPSSRIRVCVRLRPDDSQSQYLNVDPIDHTINLTSIGNRSSDKHQHNRSGRYDRHGSMDNGSNNERQYKFDKVLSRSTTQKQVYEECALSIVRSSISGYNGTILAYGQTGAGKTYTTLGEFHVCLICITCSRHM